MKRVNIFLPLQILHSGKTGCPYSKSAWAHFMPKSLSHLTTTVLDSAGFFPHPGVKITTNLCTIVALLVVMEQWVILRSNWPLGSPVHFFLNLFMLFLRFLFLCRELLFSLLPTIPSSCIRLLVPLFLPIPKCVWCCSGGGTKSGYLFPHEDVKLPLKGGCFQREVHVSWGLPLPQGSALFSPRSSLLLRIRWTSHLQLSQ